MAAGDFDMTAVASQQAAKVEEPDDEIAAGMLKSYKAYKRGHYSAAMVEGARSLNLLSGQQGINGGGWS